MADNYLITGYHGAPHVTAENDRGINAAMFGIGRFVLPVGEQFRAEYIGNNTIRVYDGKLVDNGAVAGIPAGEYVDLPIVNAGQGMKRNDLIVFQYQQDTSTLIESGTFVVVQGTEASGTASDPELTQNDLLTNKATFDQMALWRIPVSSGTISEPVKLFSVYENSPTHKQDKNNPHSVTAKQVGLGNVNNTSDADKPISTAQANAIADAKKAGTDAQTAASKAQTTANNALTLAAIVDDAHTIPEHADLNEYTTIGAYRCSTAAIAATLENAPTYTLSGFRLIVSVTSREEGLMQTAIFNTPSSDRIYWRIRNHNDAWSSWYRVVGHTVGLNEELWSGAWKSGSITVPNTSDYKMFLIALDGVGTMIPAFKHNGYIRGVGGYTTSDSAVSTYQFAASYSNNNWTLAACNSITHTNSGNHGSATDRTVSSIIGFL